MASTPSVRDVEAAWTAARASLTSYPPGTSTAVDNRRDELLNAAIAALAASPARSSKARALLDRVVWAGLMYPSIKCVRAALKRFATPVPVQSAALEYERLSLELRDLTTRYRGKLTSLLTTPFSVDDNAARCSLCIFIGDLWRYEAEAPPPLSIAGSAALATDHGSRDTMADCTVALTQLSPPWRASLRAYLAASLSNPSSPHPHNQLAVVAQLAGSDAECAYRWMRAQAGSGGPGGAMTDAARATLLERFEANRRSLDSLEADPRVRRLASVGAHALAHASAFTVSLGRGPALSQLVVSSTLSASGSGRGGGRRGRSGQVRGTSAPMPVDAASHSRGGGGDVVVAHIIPSEMTLLEAALRVAQRSSSSRSALGSVVSPPYSPLTALGSLPPLQPIVNDPDGDRTSVGAALLAITLERVVRLAGMVALGTDLEQLPALARAVGRDVGRLASAQAQRVLAADAKGSSKSMTRPTLLPAAWMPRIVAVLAWAVDDAAPPSALSGADEAARARVRRAYAIHALFIVTARIARAIASFLRALRMHSPSTGTDVMGSSARHNAGVGINTSQRRDPLRGSSTRADYAADEDAADGGASSASDDTALLLDRDDDGNVPGGHLFVAAQNVQINSTSLPLQQGAVTHLSTLLTFLSAFAGWLNTHLEEVAGSIDEHCTTSAAADGTRIRVGGHVSIASTPAAGRAVKAGGNGGRLDVAKSRSSPLQSGDPAILLSYARRLFLDSYASACNKLVSVLPGLLSAGEQYEEAPPLMEIAELRGFPPFGGDYVHAESSDFRERAADVLLANECTALTGVGSGSVDIAEPSFNGAIAAVLCRARRVVAAGQAMVAMPACALKLQRVGTHAMVFSTRTIRPVNSGGDIDAAVLSMPHDVFLRFVSREAPTNRADVSFHVRDTPSLGVVPSAVPVATVSATAVLAAHGENVVDRGRALAGMSSQESHMGVIQRRVRPSVIPLPPIMEIHTVNPDSDLLPGEVIFPGPAAGFAWPPELQSNPVQAPLPSLIHGLLGSDLVADAELGEQLAQHENTPPLDGDNEDLYAPLEAE